MKKTIVSIMKKSGEKVAQVPANVRSWPTGWNQPEMPSALRKQMKETDKQ
ncbi:MAG: hypothetical protein FWE19_04250 [Oscillospiraceae bacterium]|nr:hypothetical protein [Oscillospiraceae bacterium]